MDWVIIAAIVVVVAGLAWFGYRRQRTRDRIATERLVDRRRVTVGVDGRGRPDLSKLAGVAHGWTYAVRFDEGGDVPGHTVVVVPYRRVGDAVALDIRGDDVRTAPSAVPDDLLTSARSLPGCAVTTTVDAGDGLDRVVLTTRGVRRDLGGFDTAVTLSVAHAVWLASLGRAANPNPRPPSA